MRIKRTLPPAAAPMDIGAIISGLRGVKNGQKEIERFHSELKAFYQVENCYLLSSGKAALFIILKVLHHMHPDRNAVVIPAFTCYSVPSAIVKAGLKIRLCDVDQNTLDFDFDQLSDIHARESKGILAVVPTHLYGISPDIDKIRRIVCDTAITIVEDAAQGMGGMRKGKKNGSMGDVGFVSLSRGKAFSTVEGGIILTEREDIAAAIGQQVGMLPEYNLQENLILLLSSVFMVVFIHPSLFWFPKLLPFLKLGDTLFSTDFAVKKMSAFQAGLSKGWQQKLAAFNETRSTNSEYWLRFFQLLSEKSPAVAVGEAGCGQCDSIFSVITDRLSQSCLRFPVKINAHFVRNRILERSEWMGLGIAPSYPDSVDGIVELIEFFRGQFYPAAKEVAEKLVTLPVHTFVNEIDQNKICRLFTDSLKKNNIQNFRISASRGMGKK